MGPQVDFGPITIQPKAAQNQFNILVKTEVSTLHKGQYFVPVIEGNLPDEP